MSASAITPGPGRHATGHDQQQGEVLRLDSPVWLLRAASTCKRWLRVVAGAAFLRRFRARHGAPVVAGFYHNRNLFLRPRFYPSPSSAAIDAGRFSLDFLPGGDVSNWRIHDTRGSLLLLVREDCSKDGSKDMILCEPLTRRHVTIPPLTPSAAFRAATATLLAGGGGEIGMSSFRVLCLVHEDDSTIHAGVFTAACGGDGEGRGMWRGTSTAAAPEQLQFIGAVAGRRYYHNGDKKVVVLDEGALEFSAFVLPDGERWHRHSVKVALTEARGDGEARIVVAGGCTTPEDYLAAAAGDSFPESAAAVGVHSTLKVFARVRREGGNGDGCEVWALEKTIRLSPAMLGLPRLARFYLKWYTPIVTGTVHMWVPTAGNFRLDIETLEVERLPESGVWLMSKAFPCELPWPPSFLRAPSPSA
ncbi:unnamed protein product [Urochloa humidicola]